MGKSEKQHHKKLQSFLSNLDGLLDSLPSESDKQEVTSGFLKLIEFLTDLKTRLELLPSVEEVSTLRDVVQKIEQSMSRAENDPVLAAAFGLGSPRPRRSESRVSRPPSTETKTLLESLESLPVEEIQSKLQANTYSLTILRSVASALGIGPAKELGRDALAHQIAMRIANSRGYQHLRGDSSPRE